MTKRQMLVLSFLIAVALRACVVPVEETVELEDPYEAPEAPDKPDIPPGSKAPGPDMCGPSGMKNGIPIPTECYHGPPRWLPEEQQTKEKTNPVPQKLSPKTGGLR